MNSDSTFLVLFFSDLHAHLQSAEDHNSHNKYTDKRCAQVPNMHVQPIHRTKINNTRKRKCSHTATSVI